MPRQARSKAAKIAEEAIGESIQSIESIDQGQDGEKFKVTTAKGEVLFCRVKEEAGSQELPYQEADVLNQVSSTHVVRPLKVDKIRGHYVLIRPFIKGQNLAERLRQSKLSVAEIKKLASVLFETAEALASVGAVHFDIKPENIIAEASGDYKLIDFGAAKFLKKMTTERIHPARKFIAPEVLRYLFEPNELALQRLSILSDMYGIGAVLYTCITGHSVAEFFRSSSDVLQKVPPPVRHFESAFDTIIADLVDRLLSKEPARRPRPEDAHAILNGQVAKELALPNYFLRVKPGRGTEHVQVLDAVISSPNETGVYWTSDSAPKFPKSLTPSNIIWETPSRANHDDLATDLLRQYEHGVMALCISGHELENSANAAILKSNLALIDSAIEWRKNFATHLPVFALIQIEDALLVSSQADGIRDAYASKKIDGVILRVCMPDRTALDARQMRAIKKFIEPWAVSKRAVLFDGNLAAMPLSIFGVSSLIAATYPRLRILTSRANNRPPGQPRRPDGIYLPRFLAVLSADNVTILRASQFGKSLTNCSCPYCAATLMRRNRLSQWDRASRRKHFVYVFPKDIASVRSGGIASLQQRIQGAKNEAARFSLMRIDLSHLKVWQDFLANP